MNVRGLRGDRFLIMQDTLPQYLENYDPDNPDHVVARNNLKLSADKIREKLGNVLNNPNSSARRWVWELVQNAKDLPRTKFDQVSIQIVLSKDSLKFEHNGDPFLLANLIGLVQQVSTKDSTNANEEVTGKFGTGFIATHLLSSIIEVGGVVKHKGVYRRFEVTLDRSGDSSEELLLKIDKALSYVKNIEDDNVFLPLPSYDENRSEESYDTSFTYALDSEEKFDAAKSGLDDLINTLPLTLVNLNAIKKVAVINEVSEYEESYSVSLIKESESIQFYSVFINSEGTVHSQYFIKARSENIILISEIKSIENLDHIEVNRRTPYLFRDFPLIGSEKFYFPFITNGLRFNPSEKRDGLLIHSKEGKDHIDNRRYIEEAFELAKELVSKLIEFGSHNRYVYAKSRLPKEEWVDFSKGWYKQLQADYRQFLLKKPIVETDENTFQNLEDCWIPNYGGTDETKKEFYQLMLPFLGGGIIPKEDIILEWIDALGPVDEIDSWNCYLSYGLDNFLDELEKEESLIKLEERLDGIKTIKWLNSVYDFLIRQHQTASFNEKKIIPTMNGEFKSLKELHEEDKEASIPDQILDILHQLELPWRDEIIHREVELPGQNIGTRDLIKASHAFNEVLKEEFKNPYGKSENKFLKREDAFEILIRTLKLMPQHNSGESFRSKVFLKAKELFRFDDVFEEVSSLKEFRFDLALKHLIKVINDKIHNVENINSLAEELNKDNDKAVLWLDDYLSNLEGKEDFKLLLEYGNVIPNRVGGFKAYDQVYGFGTDETPLDDRLIDIFSDLDPNSNWKNFLLLDGISLNLEPKKFDELGTAIDERIIDLEKEEADTNGSIIAFKKPILDLIKWCKDNDDLAQTYLKRTVPKSNDLWVKFSMSDDTIELLKDEGSIELLKQIRDLGLSISDEKMVIDYANSLVGLSDKGKKRLAEKAEQILEEERDFDFKRQVGEKVEDFLNQLFRHEFPHYEIRYVGKGAYDFLITNPQNGKKYSIELKSIKAGNSSDIKMAISQARHAFKYPENYALLLIRRPADGREINDEFLKANLKCVYQIGKNVEVQVRNSFQIEEIINQSDSIKLSVEDPTMKVVIRQEYIDKLGKTFESLKSVVQQAIQ